jgi:hypothetical protein
MPDEVLPWPKPDWDNPTPVTAPSHEQTQAFARLHKTADGIREWIHEGFVHGTQPEDWANLGDALRDVADMCQSLSTPPTDQSSTTEP